MNILDIRKKYHNLQPLDLDLLVSHAISKPREYILVHSEYQFSTIELIKFKFYLWQYSRGYSVAAIIGHKEFFGLDFFVDKHVLIPRPETELMVEEALKEIASMDGNITLIDVGAGSGCVPISIGKNSPKNINTIAVDISRQALKVAKKNAQKHSVEIKFFQSNLLSKLSAYLSGIKSAVIITANLPYLTDKQFEEEPSIQREPKMALVANNNGLELYKKLLDQTKKIFGNKKIILFLEIDPVQSEPIKKIILHTYKEAQIEIKKDLSGLDRLVKIST